VLGTRHDDHVRVGELCEQLAASFGTALARQHASSGSNAPLSSSRPAPSSSRSLA